MLELDLKFAEDTFKKYYFEHFDLLSIPNRASEREFGYQKFNGGIMNRHISIKSNEELRLMLITNIPSDVYCSNAYYSFPNLPMSEKDWKGADLIFDIDAKDLNLDCRLEHTCIKCISCNEVSVLQSTCPSCKSTKIAIKSLTCKNCINGAKEEVIKLKKILEDDLGIKNEKIQVYFSGNEGFHVHVTDSPYQLLGSRERNELVDYIMFRGAMPETFGMKKVKPQPSSFVEIDAKGWEGRVAENIFGSKSKRSKVITEIITNGYSVFQQRLDNLKETIGVKIDPNVTIDIHRIFRLPGSLNSKSGLSKVLCENMDKFNPFQDSCFIDDENTTVLANCLTPFTLKNKKFGPYKNEKITIPKYAAIYLICKGLANVV